MAQWPTILLVRSCLPHGCFSEKPMDAALTTSDTNEP